MAAIFTLTKKPLISVASAKQSAVKNAFTRVLASAEIVSSRERS